MTASHPLDRPVWNALNGHQAAFAQGGARALRFAPRFSPLAAAASSAPEDLSALAALDDGAGLYIVEPEVFPTPPGMTVTVTAPCDQMIARAVKKIPPDFDVVELGDADASEMLALALLTKPGPFSTHTHKLGRFIGVKQNGKLVAMAGERMRIANFSEVSGVCTHPDHRGHGYARVLSSIVANRILDRGETPFLHSYASNRSAIALYEGLGFTLHSKVTLTVIRRI